MNSQILSFVYIYFLLPDWKDYKGNETPCAQLVGTHLWVDRVFGSTLKMPSKEANNFDVLYIIETSDSTLEKKCCLMRNFNYSLEWNAVRKVCSHKKKNVLECMQIFPAGWPTSTSTSGWWWWEEVLWFFGQDYAMWPKTPSILPLHVQQLVLTAFLKAVKSSIIKIMHQQLQVYQHVSSLDYLIHEFGHWFASEGVLRS